MVDMRAEFREVGKEEIFSRRLVEETRAALDRGEQVLLLLNRRGYSFVVICRSCGEKVECENCAIAMTYHKGAGSADESSDGLAEPGTRLECHYCGFRRVVPKTCPKCASEHLYFLGAGSQQGEEKLQELFPDARIGRMDRDTVRGRFDMERLLARLHAGEINLLVGTQMMAKGHDIHGVTLVGVVGADHALGLPDFRAAERVFQLLTQVSGRAGRGDLAGKVLVQTYHPEHYAVKFAAQHDYTGFVAKEISFRRSRALPAVQRARECPGAERQDGRSGGLGGAVGTILRAGKDSRGQGAWPSRSSDREAEENLPVSPDPQSAAAQGAERSTASDARVCRGKRRSASQSGGRCGRRKLDVRDGCQAFDAGC